MSVMKRHVEYFNYRGVQVRRPRRRSEIPLSERSTSSQSEALRAQSESAPVEHHLKEGVVVTIDPKASDVSKQLSSDELAAWMTLAQENPTLLRKVASKGNLAAQRAIMKLLELRNQEPK